MDTVTIFGEVLFDCFASGEKVLGGAPFNVAWHLQAFGRAPRFVSRVGLDDPGNRIRDAMRTWNMSIDSLQTDRRYPTGEVLISLERGEPTYEIVKDVAYDFIDAAQLDIRPCSVLYHGTLALRNEASRQALGRLKTGHPDTVFMDVNLRDPWWQRDVVTGWLDQADWVKLNEEEFGLLHDGSNPFTEAESFRLQHGLSGLVVTRGAKGALAVIENQPPIVVAPGESLDIVDTVGAGDAFASVLLVGLNLGWPIRETLARAQVFASALVQRRGATVNDPGFYQPFIDAWNLS